ncbi:TIGR03643 family protein [Mucilaginibacter xinganensis]|uniref:RNA methyltransferase n=1 Tax=Mucilaginibacter xinganensis TaxID=1234841 RepID=A0A223NWT7_9SPHI|nr:TIGR03643 family protein [Mucilaginibacter xinganensis]ASU34337.1 RNA methyltransferase [Mucilaginibacter xinganensis]
MSKALNLDVRNTDRVIEMAWEDRTSFDAIKLQFGINEQQVIELMRRELKLTSFKLWRTRVQGRSTKHQSLGEPSDLRFKCSMQKHISFNKISKRK